MTDKRIITIIIIVIISFSLIISIPIMTFSTIFSSYSKIDESFTFYYKPSNFSETIELNLSADVGNIEIKYIYPPVDYEAKIEVSIEMIGQNLAGKTSLDYFNIVWENESTQLNFIMMLKSGINQLEVLSLIENIIIIINLNANKIFDIDSTAIHGNIDIVVPFGVTIKNLEANNTYGKISYILTHCTILGDIVGINDEGDVEFKTLDVEYAQNCSLFLDTNTGDILVEIHQNRDIGANITGIIKNAGIINIIYRDNSANIGALFLLHNTNQFFTYWDQWVGFLLSSLEGGNGYIFQSFDFPTRYNYNLSFYKKNWLGRYYVDLISVPFSSSIIFGCFAFNY